MAHAPTEQQAAVIASVANGDTDDLIVNALAGTGKTTTIINAIKARPAGRSVTLCAFNASIARELQERIRGEKYVRAATLHGLGKAAVDARFGRVEVDKFRESRLAADVCGEAPPVIAFAVSDLACAVKECAPDVATDRDAIERVGRNLGLIPSGDELDRTSWTKNGILTATALVVERSLDLRRDPSMSFPDMMYLPIALGLTMPRPDIVVVDELQDLSRAQILLTLRMRGQGSRLLGVGDRFQSIYAWRGAEPESMDRLRIALKARAMALTVTHRCAHAIVEEARTLVPDLEAAPGAAVGAVNDVTWAGMVDGAAPGDFVIGRNNSILALACLRLLRKGTRARIAGSEMAPTMVALLKRLARGCGDDLVKVAERIAQWKDREIRIARARANENAESLARDKADTLDAILDDSDTIEEMVTRINLLFEERPDARYVVCSTVHRAKGLEADRVWMLCDSFTEPRSDASPITVQEEANLRYVTITRARLELNRVRG